MFKILVNVFLNVGVSDTDREDVCVFVSYNNWASDSDSMVCVFWACFKDIVSSHFSTISCIFFQNK
jgi:hypothetical protein